MKKTAGLAGEEQGEIRWDLTPYIVSETQGTTSYWSLTGRKWQLRK